MSPNANTNMQLNARNCYGSSAKMSPKSLALERLNGSFLTHSELQLHVTQGIVTLEAKYFMTFLGFMCQIHRRSWYTYTQSHS